MSGIDSESSFTQLSTSLVAAPLWDTTGIATAVELMGQRLMANLNACAVAVARLAAEAARPYEPQDRAGSKHFSTNGYSQLSQRSKE